MKMEEINKYEIFKKMKLNQDFIKNIKLFHVFEDYWNKVNVITVTKDDKTFVFGCNLYGALGFGHENEVKKLTQNEDLSKKQLIDFKNSRYHVIARSVDGKVYCWGQTYSGVLGNGRNDDKIYKPELNKYLSDKNIIDICCGGWHSLVLTTEGQVYAWGLNNHGQVGKEKDKIRADVPTPFHVNKFNGEKVKAIACGWKHSMALTEKGNVFSWGENDCGLKISWSSNLKRNNDLNDVPKPVEINEVLEKINCGSNHGLLLSRDGDIYVFGSNKSGQLGDETIKEKSETPLKLKSINKFIDIASHWRYDISMALSKEGIIFIWGQCGEEVIKTPIETQFESFDEVFAHYFQITYISMNIENKSDIQRNLKQLADSAIAVPLKPQSRAPVMAQKNDVMGEINLFANNIKPTTTPKQVKEKSPSHSTQPLTTLNPEFKRHAMSQKNDVTDETRYKREFLELEIIGSGSFGKVYKVFNLFDEQNYAMKKILLSGLSDELKEKSSKELKLMAKLQSDHVVQYKNSWIENNEILFVQMELCFNTLKEILLKKRNEFQRNEFQPMSQLEYYVSSELFKEILEAVNFLHKQNPPIIHRDLKPTNILVTNGMNGRFIKLADFGLAAVHKFDEQTHTQGLGTIKYTAPEVLRGKSYDLKADIYSLGSVTQQVFDIDIDSSSGFSIADPLLNEKYLAIYKIIMEMMSPMKNSRPDCDQILREKSLWTLDMNELEIDFSQLSLNEQSIEENFHIFFIKTKLRFR